MVIAIVFISLIGVAINMPLEAQVIEVANTPLPPVVESPLPSCSVAEKLKEQNLELKNIPLQVGKEEIIYTERRISTNEQGRISVTQKEFKDPARQIALEILNLKTCETRVIVITKRGAELIASPGYIIDVIERPNGIRWNYWNTQYRIAKPGDFVVIRNKWPDTKIITESKLVKNKSGKMVRIKQEKQVIEEFIYSPYSTELHTGEVVASAKDYLDKLVARAFQVLRERKVYSKSLPKNLVSDVEALKPEYFERLPILEQTDLSEFILDPDQTSERPLVTIGLNGPAAFSKTGSKAGARGLMQYTKPTYDGMRQQYPKAKLIADFEQGTSDHLNSMIAAILLYDYNLRDLIKKFGSNITKDPRLEEYLAAAYNGRPVTAHKSLSESIGAGLSDWISKLKSETKGYMLKLRYLNSQPLTSQ